MRTLEKIFPGLFAAIGISIVATWFALLIIGKATMLVHILFLFATAFIFELYSSNQEYEAKEEKRKKERAEAGHLLNRVEKGEAEDMMHEHELEEEYHA